MTPTPPPGPGHDGLAPSWQPLRALYLASASGQHPAVYLLTWPLWAVRYRWLGRRAESARRQADADLEHQLRQALGDDDSDGGTR